MKEKALLFFMAFGCVMTFVFCPLSSVYAQSGSVILWNKLGSLDEILHSEIGPNIQLTSYKIEDWEQAQFLPAQFGDGLFINHDINEGWDNDGGNFFAVNLDHAAVSPERGTLEFWFTFKYDSGMHNHAYFFANRNAFTDHFSNGNINTNVHIYAGWNGWDYGDYGKRFFFGIRDAENNAVTIYTPDYSAAPGGYLDFNKGSTVHFAFVWDVSGIDETEDTMRLYVDGNIEASSKEIWSTVDRFDPYLYLGSSTNCSYWDHYYNAVYGITDNLIIWNYAKTDFSDRFNEDPTFPFPDGTIAFAGSDSYPDDMDIYIMNGNGSDVKPFIVNQGNDISPSFSPDGEKLAFISDRSGQWAIYIINTDGTGFYKVPDSEFSFHGDIVNNAVNWSPDSQKLVYLATDSIGGLGIINSDGSGKTILATEGVGDGIYNTVCGVNWGAASDELIVHMLASDRQQNIFKYSISNDTWTQMTLDDTPSHTMDAAVSISGRDIVFTRRADDSRLYDLYIMENSPGAQSVNLTCLSLGEGAFHPEWINNDEQIIFSYNIEGTEQWQIGVIYADGSDLKILPVLSSPQYAMYPTWTSKTVCHVKGDLNGDSAVDDSDFMILKESLGKCTGDSDYNPDADYDDDGCISFIDYSSWYRNYYLER